MVWLNYWLLRSQEKSSKEGELYLCFIAGGREGGQKYCQRNFRMVRGVDFGEKET